MTPALLLCVVVALFFALLAWAITSAVDTDTLLLIVAGGGPDARSYATDHTGLDALAAALNTGVAAAGAATSQVQEGLSFCNRPPGLAILGVAFGGSVVISGAAAIAFWSGTYLHGALLKGERWFWCCRWAAVLQE